MTDSVAQSLPVQRASLAPSLPVQRASLAPSLPVQRASLAPSLPVQRASLAQSLPVQRDRRVLHSAPAKRAAVVAAAGVFALVMWLVIVGVIVALARAL